MYSPTTSRTLSTSWGSGESLNDSDTWGLSPNVRQIRPIIVWLIPAFSAIERVLQCVSPGGVLSSVWTMTASTAASEIVRGPPTRGSSYSPAKRRSTNRVRHFPTVALVVRYRRATTVFVTPSVHASTSRARNARRRFTCARFVKRTNSARSSAVTASATLGRPIVAMPYQITLRIVLPDNPFPGD